MTNIMAVTVGYKEKLEENIGRAVYICTDSQATGWEQKGNVQKLFRRGGNLITSTGTHKRAIDSIHDLDQLNKSVEPAYIAERLLDFGRANFKFRDEKDRQDYVVVGLEKGEPVIYSIILSKNSLNPHSGYPPIAKVPHSFRGSGSRQTIPAIQRDMETGNLRFDDLTEGMSFIFSLANRADIDLFVNDRLQIGLVTPNQTRLLYHPAVTSDGGLTDEMDYFGVNFPILTLQTSPEGSVTPDNLRAGLNDLYHALLVSCRSMEIEDRSVNAANTAAKTDFSNREKHQAESQKALERRDKRKSHVDDLVDSWTSGDFSRLANALKRYHHRREEIYGSGVEA